MKAIYLLVFLLFSGCAYQPTSHFAKKELEGNVFVKLFIESIIKSNNCEIVDFF